MIKGICLFAQKNEKSDYYKQAVACAMSIKAFNPKEQICLITDMKVKTEHEKYFDVTSNEWNLERYPEKISEAYDLCIGSENIDKYVS